MRLLVAGIGNVFLGDDGFGVAVVERLRSRPPAEDVDVVDFGIRGIDLAYALEEYDAAIIVDIISRGRPPGTLCVLDPVLPAGGAAPEMHAMTPDRVLAWINRERAPATLRVVGCEPLSFGPADVGQIGLSEQVQGAVEEAAMMVQALVSELRGKTTADA